jgi:hypothetical protein
MPDDFLLHQVDNGADVTAQYILLNILFHSPQKEAILCC